MNRHELEIEALRRARALRQRLVEEGTYTPQTFRAALVAELQDLREEIFESQVSDLDDAVDRESTGPHADWQDGELKLRDGRRIGRRFATPEHFAEAEQLAREELAEAVQQGKKPKP
jgi:hypothetical protein